MVSFGANEMIIVLLVIFIIVLLLSVLNPAKSLEESRRNRVKDLIVVGLILWFSPSVKVAGMVIFFYGFGILLYEKYQEGKREALGQKDSG
ncbi:hypothetical protein [Geoglobus ahangari]